MKRILITIVLASILPFSATVLADEQGKEERKYYQEQDREERKHYEEQEREARKHYEEREREEREHWKEKKHDGKGKKYGKKHRRHEYRYYPRSSVYYDEKKKVYFYLEGDKWGVSVNLPGGISLGVQDYVTIQTDEERPHNDYPEHQRKYGGHR